MSFYKQKWVVASMAVFVVFNVFFSYFFLCAGREQLLQRKRINQHLSEVYVDFQAIDIKKVLAELTRKLEWLEKKKSKLLDQALTEDNIAVFATSLESTAEKLRLNLNPPVMSYQTAEQGSYNTAHFELKFKGSFSQAFEFLKQVDGLHSGLLIEHLTLQADEKREGMIVGQLTLRTFVKVDSSATL